VLRERVRLLELELYPYVSDYFRVCIFGSARIRSDDEIYKSTYELALRLGELGIDVLTGGGPGLMEAATRGAVAGKQRAGTKSRTIGLTIDLNAREYPNDHLDVKVHHRKFSSRLDDFMRLSNAIIVERGGIGTLLELYFAWQLVQVGHLPMRPIILMDSAFWAGLIAWMKEEQLKRGLLSAIDFDCIHLADKPDEALEIIRAEHAKWHAQRTEAPDANT